MSQLAARKIGFIGAGNMTQTILGALLETKTVSADQIFVTNRTPGKLQRVKEQFSIATFANNEELVEKCDVVIISVKPQDLIAAIEPISSSFGIGHMVISLAAGVSLGRLRRLLPGVKQIVRVMPNTPARIRQGVTGYCLPSDAQNLASFVEALFKPLGMVVQISEGDAFEALTVAASAGVGFVFELMLYWQEWLEEHDFDPVTARAMTVKTFLGAALLAEQSANMSIEDLQNRVTSKKGVTAAGLASMQELEIERLLRYSFEKAALRDREIAEEQRG